MDAFIDWIFNNTKIRKNPLVAIKKSHVADSEGGYGVFIDTSELDLTSEDTVELLRIPRNETYFVKTIYEQLDTDIHPGEYNQKLKFYMSQFIGNECYGQYINETNLVVIFLIITAALSKSIEVPPTLHHYLEDVLFKTEVPVPVNKYQEDYKSWHESMKEYLNFPQEKFLEILNDYCTRQFPQLELSEEVSRVYSSVISRILEIPEAVNEHSEDFFVNPTLVPILDFVNHSNDSRNAYYDIDRSNNDIVLLLEPSLADKSECTEVFISYSPTEELVHFVQVYGFIPKSKQAQVLCLRLDQEFLEKTSYRDLNLSHFYHKMSIRPVLQLVLYPGEALVDNCTETFGLMLLPFAREPNDPDKSFFKYDANMNGYKCTINSEQNEAEMSLAAPQCVDMIFSSEESPIYDKSRIEFGKMLLSYVNHRLEKLNKLSPNSQSSSFSHFLSKEREVLETLLRQINNNEEIMWYEKYGESGRGLPVSEMAPICPFDV